jgi:nudix-type nucleoside diphosphatase (YffH/AdpP family)
MPGPHKVEIHEQKRLLDDFFKVDEVKVSHERHDGKMSPDERRLIFERGDAAAVLLYNEETHMVVMVNQFKVPSMVGRQRDNPSTTNGWITETVAGMIEKSETPEDAVIRETQEETGYKIQKPELICRFFSSPGGTSERIFLYFAKITDADKIGKGGGLSGEDIKVVTKSANELFDELAKKQIEDPKLVIAAYWLQDYIRRTPPLEPRTHKFALTSRPDCIVGYKTGSLEEVRGVSIWVNSENTDMMMDRFIGRTISARIRYLGANKEEDTVLEDTIQESLRTAIGERAHVKIGTVLVTESGMLMGSHEVEQIFHVATVEGGPGAGVKADLDKIKLCVDRVLKRVEQENRKWSRLLRKKLLQSIIFPMMGAGDGGLTPEAVAQNIIPVAINYYRNTPDPTLNEIYFLAFKTRERSACDHALETYCAKGELKRLGSA